MGPAPKGFLAVGVFLFFGATMAGYAAITLFWPGTLLDRLWKLNPRAHEQLSPFGARAASLFLMLAMALIVAGIGWLLRRRWGWTLAVVIIGIQVVGDLVNCLRGDVLRGGVGVVIAGALLLFLSRRNMRAAFD
jgi:hypothetical protein